MATPKQDPAFLTVPPSGEMPHRTPPVRRRVPSLKPSKNHGSHDAAPPRDPSPHRRTQSQNLSAEPPYRPARGRAASIVVHSQPSSISSMSRREPSPARPPALEPRGSTTQTHSARPEVPPKVPPKSHSRSASSPVGILLAPRARLEIPSKSHSRSASSPVGILLPSRAVQPEAKKTHSRSTSAPQGILKVLGSTELARSNSGVSFVGEYTSDCEAKGCSDHEHSVGAHGEQVHTITERRHTPNHREVHAVPGVLKRRPSSMFGRFFSAPAAGRRNPRLPMPHDDLFNYLAQCRVGSVGLGWRIWDVLGVEGRRRAEEANRVRARSLALWTRAIDFPGQVLDFLNGVPRVILPGGSFTLAAPGFTTTEYPHHPGWNRQSHVLMDWFRGTVLETTQSALQSLGHTDATFTFLDTWTEGMGSLVLQNAKGSRMLIAVRPAGLYRSHVLNAFTETTSWAHLRLPATTMAPKGLANALQAQLYDECAKHQTRYFVLTTLKYWVFGVFSLDWSSCNISPPIRREARQPSVAQALVAWSLKAITETRGAPARPQVNAATTVQVMGLFAGERKEMTEVDDHEREKREKREQKAKRRSRREKEEREHHKRRNESARAENREEGGRSEEKSKKKKERKRKERDREERKERERIDMERQRIPLAQPYLPNQWPQHDPSAFPPVPMYPPFSHVPPPQAPIYSAPMYMPGPPPPPPMPMYIPRYR